MDDEELEATVYQWYIWDCPACGETQEASPPDVDPTGEVHECRECYRSVRITATVI